LKITDPDLEQKWLGCSYNSFAPLLGAKNGSAAVVSAVARPRNPAQGSKLGAFSQLYINFEHEKRCIQKCFMMEGKQKQVRPIQ